MIGNSNVDMVDPYQNQADFTKETSNRIQLTIEPTEGTTKTPEQ